MVVVAQPSLSDSSQAVNSGGQNPGESIFPGGEDQLRSTIVEVAVFSHRSTTYDGEKMVPLWLRRQWAES